MITNHKIFIPESCRRQRSDNNIQTGPCAAVMSSQRGHAVQRGNPQLASSNSFDNDTDSQLDVDQETTTLSKNQLFDVLRNSRRRTAVACLRDHGGTMSVTELATCVAAEEYDVSTEELSSKQYKRVYTGLYQCHLDRADELGVIDFDAEENTVRLSEEASQLDPYLDDEAPGSTRVEFSTALVVGLIVALSATGVGPFGVLTPNVLAMLTIAALFGLALLQLY